MTARDRELVASLRETARAWRAHVRWTLWSVRRFERQTCLRENLRAAWRCYKRANKLACGGWK